MAPDQNILTVITNAFIGYIKFNLLYTGEHRRHPATKGGEGANEPVHELVRDSGERNLQGDEDGSIPAIPQE